MKTQPTPGPWNIIEAHCNLDCLEWIIECSRPATESCRENPRIAICDEMGGSIDGREEGKANAQLIAAAPDLLGALEDLNNAYGVQPFSEREAMQRKAWIKARAAIAKATS